MVKWSGLRMCAKRSPKLQEHAAQIAASRVYLKTLRNLRDFRRYDVMALGNFFKGPAGLRGTALCLQLL